MPDPLQDINDLLLRICRSVEINIITILIHSDDGIAGANVRPERIADAARIDDLHPVHFHGEGLVGVPDADQILRTLHKKCVNGGFAQLWMDPGSSILVRRGMDA